jgi:bifunctional non-homologous end joining protein LigD
LRARSFGEPVVFNLKHDGYRLIARRDKGGVRLLTRNGYDWSGRYPSVTTAVSALRCRSCVIDGEVVITGDNGHPIFERLQRGPRIKPEALMVAFDLLELNGRDLRREPLIARKVALEKLLRRVDP